MTHDEHFNVVGIDEMSGDAWHEGTFSNVRDAMARAMAIGRRTTARMTVYGQDGRWCADISTPSVTVK